MKPITGIAAVVLLGSLSIQPAQASTIEYSSLAAFSAATMNPSVTAFNGILGPAECCHSFNPLIVDGISFSTPNAGAFVNVTEEDFYSPNNYPGDFIVDSVNPGPNNVLNIAFPSPIFAFGMDFGGLFNGGANRVILSNGFTANEASSPTVGNTEFRGFVSTDPIVGLQLTLFNDSWVAEDVVRATPLAATVPEPATLLLLGSGLAAAARLRKRTTT